MLEVRKDGIYDTEKCVNPNGDTEIIKNNLIMSKDAFIEAFQKYVLPRLDCIDASAVQCSPVITFKEGKN